MSFFRKIGNGLARFMYGRNGMDQLNRALFWLYLILWGAEIVSGLVLKSALLIRIFEGLLFGLMLFIFFRMFSRNLTQRRSENQKWVNWVWRLKSRSAGARARHTDKDHKYFTCKTCKAICRVPVGKGNIVITCPKCGAQIKAKS